MYSVRRPMQSWRVLQQGQSERDGRVEAVGKTEEGTELQEAGPAQGKGFCPRAFGVHARTAALLAAWL